MNPITFPESNCVFAKDQPEYIPLPVYKGYADAYVVSCWQLTRKERIKLLFSGKMWICQYIFAERLQPIRPSIEKPMDMLDADENARRNT